MDPASHFEKAVLQILTQACSAHPEHNYKGGRFAETITPSKGAKPCLEHLINSDRTANDEKDVFRKILAKLLELQHLHQLHKLHELNPIQEFREWQELLQPLQAMYYHDTLAAEPGPSGNNERPSRPDPIHGVRPPLSATESPEIGNCVDGRRVSGNSRPPNTFNMINPMTAPHVTTSSSVSDVYTPSSSSFETMSHSDFRQDEQDAGHFEGQAGYGGRRGHDRQGGDRYQGGHGQRYERCEQGIGNRRGEHDVRGRMDGQSGKLGESGQPNQSQTSQTSQTPAETTSGDSLSRPLAPITTVFLNYMA